MSTTDGTVDKTQKPEPPDIGGIKQKAESPDLGVTTKGIIPPEVVNETQKALLPDMGDITRKAESPTKK